MAIARAYACRMKALAAQHYEAKRQLGLRIAHLRDQKGMSQRKFALMLDLDRVTLNRIESGRANPTIDTLGRIAAGLDVSLEDLFNIEL